MSPTSDKSEVNRSQVAYNLTLGAVAGQVGCLTLVIVLAALFSGLWLDNQLNSKPIFTIGLVIISVPITLVMMFWVVRAATSRLRAGASPASEQSKEETIGGEHS